LLINGRSGTALAVFDRGLQYGDGLFETIAFIDGKAPLWDRHMARLTAGCSVLGLPQQDVALLAAEAQHLLHGHGAPAGRRVVKIIVTRGEHGCSYFPQQGEATRILYCREWPARREQQARAGIALHHCQTHLATGSPLAGIKSLNRLEQVIAAAEVSKAGLHEGLLCDADGFMVETLMSNIFWLEQEVLHTPLLDRCGVSGVMRAEVIAQAGRFGIEVREVRKKAEALHRAEAIFLTNALGLIAVREYSGKLVDSDAVPTKIDDAIKQLFSCKSAA
jgi:4-amino-4-deoxychorismate lyase